jgi:hypothetical protein
MIFNIKICRKSEASNPKEIIMKVLNKYLLSLEKLALFYRDNKLEAENKVEL